MDIIKLAVLNRLQRDIEDTAEIETAVKGTDEICVYYSGSRIYLDHEILEEKEIPKGIVLHRCTRLPRLSRHAGSGLRTNDR